MTDAFRGKRVLVSGAGSGIGRATALAFAGQGAEVLCVDIDEASAEKAAAECAERGTPATSYRLDVADWEAVEALARDVAEQHGPLDVLVNNAGVGMSGRFLDMSMEDWRWIRSINLDGVIHACKAFGPAMVERGRGQVVNVSSGLGYTPTATEPAYGTTKAGVLAFSLALRADWSTHGVGVSAICPGVINTPIIDSTRFLGGRADRSEREKATKLFRRGHKPALVADAIVDAARRNRAVVPVGWEARLGWHMRRVTTVGAQQFIARRSL